MQDSFYVISHLNLITMTLQPGEKLDMWGLHGDFALASRKFLQKSSRVILPYGIINQILKSNSCVGCNFISFFFSFYPHQT